MNDSTPPDTREAALATGSGAPAAAAVTAEPDRPTGPLSHRQIVTILIGLMMGMFLAALDQTIVASAMRTIADDLRGLEHQAWATTAYLITATIVTPLYGKLGDIYGRKKLFIIAISIFIFGSILCTFATSMFSLAAFRAVQGLGAGGLFSLALAIIGDIVPPRERAKHQGYVLAVFGTASVLGPVIGGFFAGQETILGIDGWRWVFLVNVPIGIAALAVVSRTLHLTHNRLDHRIDWIAVSSTTCYVIGAIGVVGFFWQEWRMKEEAILPLKMFTNKTVGVSSAASVLIGVAMFGGLAALPLYLQIVKGATPTQAGLLLLPMTLGIMFGSILSGQIISRTGRYRKFPIIGSGLLAVSLFVFHYVAFDTLLWQTMIVMLFFGMGLGFNFQPLTLAVQNAVPPNQIGVATSTATFTRQIGGALGTAVFLSILFSTPGEKITSALRAAVPTADFQAALADPANAAVAEQLKAAQAGGGGAATGVLQDSSFLNGLDERIAKPFLMGFSEAMDTVFLVGSAVMVVGFLVMLLLPHVELRSGSSYDDRAKAESDAVEAESDAAAASMVAPH